MYFFIDGYNLLFTWGESSHSLVTQRNNITRSLQKLFSHYKLSGTLVFDGRVSHGEESGKVYLSPLEIAYTLKGQSADDYIIESVEISKKPHQITVISNDKKLQANARSLGARTMKSSEFIQWLKHKKKPTKTTKPQIVETAQNIERLLNIFEKRLEEHEE